jgi:hypothetical protein
MSTSNRMLLIYFTFLLAACNESKNEKLELTGRIKLLEKLNAEQAKTIASLKDQQIHQEIEYLTRIKNLTESIELRKSDELFFVLISFRYYGTKYNVDDQGSHVYNSPVFQIKDSSDDTKAILRDQTIKRFMNTPGILVKGEPYDFRINIKQSYSEASNSSLSEGKTVKEIMDEVNNKVELSH